MAFKNRGYKIVNVRKRSRLLKKNAITIAAFLALAVVVSITIAAISSCVDNKKNTGAASGLPISVASSSIAKTESMMVSSEIAKTETSSPILSSQTSSQAPSKVVTAPPSGNSSSSKPVGVTSLPTVQSGAPFNVYASAPNWTYTVDKSKPVPLQPAVGESHFSSAMFVGDSITTGIDLYDIMKSTTVVAKTGINTNTILTTKAFNNKTLTFLQKMKQSNPKHIYIMLGLNGIHFQSKENLISGYGKFIDAVKKQHPNSIIYIQSILPVTNKKQNSDSRFANSKINSYNAGLLQLAKQKGVYYLNVAEAFKDANGNLLTSVAAPDGMHLQKKGYYVWIEYLKRHTIYTGTVPSSSVAVLTSSKPVSVARPASSSSAVTTSAPVPSTSSSAQ